MRITAIYLTAITSLAFFLRVVRLDLQPLWWDEGYSVFFATRDLVTLLTRTAVDIHPPLYYALLQVWMALAGKSDVALRMFSVLVGVLAVPLVYVIGRRLLNPRVAAIAALLLAISPLHVYYSQEVRMYGLVTLLALASMALQLLILTSVPPADRTVQSRIPAPDQAAPSSRPRFRLDGRTQSRLAWLGYILVTIAALYAQYYAAFILASEIAVVLFWRRDIGRDVPSKGSFGSEEAPPRLVGGSKGAPVSPTGQRSGGATLVPWVRAWVLIFALYLPWVLYAGPKLYQYVTAKVGIENYSRLDPVTFLAQHLTAFSVGHLSEFSWLGSTALLFVALATWGLFETFRQPSRLAGRDQATTGGRADRSPTALRPNPTTVSQILLIYLLVPLLCGWLVNLAYAFHPIRYERLLLFAAPFFCLLVALGLDRLFERQARLAYAGVAAIALICATSLYDFYTVARYPDEDYRQLIREMETLAQPGDVVLAPYPWQIGYLESYYHGSPLRTVEVPSDQWISQPGQMDRTLNSIRASSTRVWLLAYQTKGRILEDQIANFFAGDYFLADDWFGNSRLQYFAQGEDPPMSAEQLGFAPDLTLVAYGLGSEPITAGAGFVRLRFHWRADSNAYSYSLRLVDRAGERRVQEDGPIAAGNEIERRGLSVPQDLSQGEYELRMVVYRRADAAALALPDGKLELTLGWIRVNMP